MIDFRKTGRYPRRQEKLSSALVVVVAAFSGCGDDFTVVSVRNLERPSDMGFACLRVLAVPAPGLGQVVSGRPMVECHEPSKDDPRRIDLGNRVQGTFGLATNTARGELAAIDFDLAEYYVSPLLDLDPRNPGYNQLPVGAQPEVISVSDDSCRAITANRGSCDLSLVDVSRLMAAQFPVKAPSSGEGPVVTHFRLRTASGEVRSAPFEVAFLPTGFGVGTREEAEVRPAPACGAEAIADPAGPVPWRALVTFPGCDLVALIHLPEGRIVSSVKILPGGVVVDAGADPICAAECAGSAGSITAQAADASAGGPIGVGALAVTPEGDRAYVGAARSSFITALEIARDEIRKLPDDGRIPLSEEPGGVTRLRLSINPYGPDMSAPPAEQGRFVGTRGKFLYAFARDGSVRVVDLNRTPGGRERECDVNVEPGPVFGGLDAPCYPVTEMRPRRLLAIGPGLRIPVSEEPEVAPPVPVDVTFAQVGSNATGFLLGSNGQIYHLAVDGAVGTPGVSRDLSTLPHNFRRVPQGQGRAGGLPHIASEPERQFTPNRVPYPTQVGFNSRADGPRLEGFTDLLDGSTRWATFPRDFATVPGYFEISWEGVLPGTERARARVERRTDGAMALTDAGADFCRSGVRAGDVLALRGCAQDGECNRDGRDLEVCHRAAPGAQGVCLPRAFVADEERLRLCRQELSSRRRYQVGEVFRTRVSFGVMLDEVPLPDLYPCQSDSVCQPDATHQRGVIGGDQGFQCLQTSSGKPRCLKACGIRAPDGSWELNDRLCRAGHVCADVGESALGPLCIEAPLPRAECLPVQISYRIQAGKAYLVNSSGLPYLASDREGAAVSPGGGPCVADPARHPLFAQRIPLSGLHCKSVVDGPDATAAIASRQTPEVDGSGWGNPCLFRGPNGDAGAADQDHVKALFENPHVRFVFTNLEQYVGDGATVSFTIDGGFSPLRVRALRPSVDFRLGTRIITGPMDAENALTETLMGAPPPYVFVIDQGRTITTLSRGQILRVNPRPAQLYPGGFIDSPDSNSLFPIQ
jgi:hypothetical protein